MNFKKNKKIAIITPILSGKGGTETVLKTILKKDTFFKDFQNVDLVILGGKRENYWVNDLPDKVRVYFSTEFKSIRFLNLFRLLFNGYTHVICLSTTILYVVNKFRSIFKKNFLIISWIHFSLFNEETVDVKRLKYADCNLAISTGIANQLKNIGISEDKIKVIFNPVDPKKELISSFSGRKLKIIYIGRVLLQGQKNLKELFDGLSLLRENSIILEIYGDGEIDECKEYIEDKNLNQSIVWHGWVDNPWNEIDGSDATILTSKYEGFPMTLLESISYGVPIISSNCPTGPDDLIKSENGYMYEMGNIKQLARILSSFDKMKFNHETVKETSEKYYTNNFLNNFWNIIKNI